MNISSAITRMALVSSASALALLLSGCDRTQDTAATADPAAAQTAATSAAGSKDCNAPGVSCTPAERGSGHGEGMEGSGHAPGMAGPGMAGREAGDGGTKMGGQPERR